METTQLFGCLDRLIPHLQLDAVAVTGGIAIQVGLSRLGQAHSRGGIDDLDLVASSTDAVGPSAVGPFLVSHYHVAGPGVPKFMIQLVDPVSRVRIDVFPDLVGSIADARMIAIGNNHVPVLPLERIFEHKLQTMSLASAAAPIDPKHVHDANVLGAVLRKLVPTVAADALAPDVYGGDADRCCTRCELSRNADWPLAPRDEIHGLLGWTRQPVVR